MEIGEALLAWLNTFDGVPEMNISSFMDLRDGKALAHVWNQISPKHIDINSLNAIQNPNDWLQILKNLRILDAVMKPVYQEKGYVFSDSLTQISKDGNVEEFVKFVSPIVMVACYSPIKAQVVANIKKLSQAHQKVLRNIITQNKNAKSRPTTPSTPPKKIISTPQIVATESISPVQNVNTISEKQENEAGTEVKQEEILQQKQEAVKTTTETINESKSEEEKQIKKENQPNNQNEHLQSAQASKPIENIDIPKPEITPVEQKRENIPPPHIEDSQSTKTEIKEHKELIEEKKVQIESPATPVQAHVETPKRSPSRSLIRSQSEEQIKQKEQEIRQLEAQLNYQIEIKKKLQDEANQKYQKSGSSRAEELRLAETILEQNQKQNELLLQQFKRAQAQREVQRIRLGALENTVAQLERKQKLMANLLQIDEIIHQYDMLNEKETELQQALEEKSVSAVSKRIEKIKSDMTSVILLSAKYGIESDTPIAKSKDDETLDDLAQRITALEFELAVVHDAVSEGKSAISPDVQTKIDEVKREVKRKFKEMKKLEELKPKCEERRKQLQQIQEVIVSKREETDRNLEELEYSINQANLEISSQIALSTSLENLSTAKTLLTKMRESI